MPAPEVFVRSENILYRTSSSRFALASPTHRSSPFNTPTANSIPSFWASSSHVVCARRTSPNASAVSSAARWCHPSSRTQFWIVRNVGSSPSGNTSFNPRHAAVGLLPPSSHMT